MAFRFLALQTAVTITAAFCALSASAETPHEAVCTLQQTVVCDATVPCERTLPAAVNLPALLRFDTKAGIIESKLDSGAVRTSKIAHSSTHKARLVLEGNDDGHPWAMQIDTKSGRFTLTVLRDGDGFLGFGVCSADILK
jgi:hypothetical protein